MKHLNSDGETLTSYQIVGGTVAPTGYLKVIQGRTLKYVLTYNRSTLLDVARRAKKLANEIQGCVVSGAEFCK